VSVELGAVVDLLAAGKIEMVACKDLHVDQVYQREVSRNLVEKIKADWDVAGAGFIVVSRRDNGDLYIVNGQHRVAARMELAIEAGDESGGEIVAQVFDGLNQQQEAQLRLIGNTKRTDTAQERFRAQVAAGNPESVNLQQLLKQFDTQINPAPNNKFGFNTVSVLEEVYRLDNGRTLQRVMEVLQDAFTNDGSKLGGLATSVAMVRAVTFMLNRHPDMDRQRFVERLANEGTLSLDRRARSHKGAVGGPLWLNYYRAFVEAYNYRLPERSQLEPRPGGWSVATLRSGRDYGDN
jgi:hypothetical protein